MRTLDNLSLMSYELVGEVIRLGDTLKLMLAIQFAMIMSIYLDIPIARQITGFVCISFIPGILILRILKVDLKSKVNTMLFSVGLSIAFLMFVGLFMNELFPHIGISKPLSTIPIMTTLSVLTLFLSFVGYRQDSVRSSNTNISNLKLEAIPYRAIILVLIPLLSIIGAIYGNTTILLLMIIAIAALYVLSGFSSRLVPEKMYILMVLAISISLLFHTSLTSKYLMGYDVPLEYQVFKSTEINGFWQPARNVSAPSTTANYKSCLSITILPTIYSLLLNVEGEAIFKIIYPLLFSLIPVVLYKIYEMQTRKLVALLSTLFFISSPFIFYGVGPLSLTRQMIGCLFFVLSMFLLVDKTITLRKRRALFMIFGAALAASHYALSYIYLFYIIFTFIILRKKAASEMKMLDSTSVLLLSAITFFWTIYISTSPFNTMAYNFKEIYYTFFIDLFNLEARSSWIFSTLSQPSSIWSLINYLLLTASQFFVVIGIVGLILKKIGSKFDSKYRLLSFLTIFLLFVGGAIPHFAGSSIGLERFFQTAFLIVAPFFVLGGKIFFSWIKKIGKFSGSYRNLELRLVSVFLIAFFLFQVGFVHHVTDDVPISIPLDMNRMKTTDVLSVRISFYEVYTPEQDVFGAMWLSKYVTERSVLYADQDSMYNVLTSYGLITREQVSILSNSTVLHPGAYIYLRHLNVVNGLICTWHETFNISEISSVFSDGNKIYSNGDSEIYCAPGN